MKQCLNTIKLVVTILVSAKGNETTLNNLILLIAISYTLNSFQVQKNKNKGVQEYILRTNEKRIKVKKTQKNMSGLIFAMQPDKNCSTTINY